jgi:hypothetical protein
LFITSTGKKRLFGTEKCCIAAIFRFGLREGRIADSYPISTMNMFILLIEGVSAAKRNIAGVRLFDHEIRDWVVQSDGR